MRTIRHTILFLAVWAVLLGGCSSWRPVVPLPDEASYPPGGRDGKRLHRVELVNRDRFVLKNVHVTGDSLRGMTDPAAGYDAYRGEWTYAGRHWSTPCALPLRAVSLLERKDQDPKKTIALALTPILIVGVIAAYNSMWDDFCLGESCD